MANLIILSRSLKVKYNSVGLPYMAIRLQSYYPSGALGVFATHTIPRLICQMYQYMPQLSFLMRFKLQKLIVTYNMIS